MGRKDGEGDEIEEEEVWIDIQRKKERKTYVGCSNILDGNPYLLTTTPC